MQGLGGFIGENLDRILWFVCQEISFNIFDDLKELAAKNKGRN
jgi:hypothetical protein